MAPFSCVLATSRSTPFHFYGESHTNVAQIYALRRLEYDFDTKTLTPIEHILALTHCGMDGSMADQSRLCTPVRGRFFIQVHAHGFINDCRVGSRVHRRGLLRRVFFWRLRTVFVQVNEFRIFAGDVGHFTHHAQRTPVQPDGPLAQRPHRAHIVADKQHRRTSVLNILDTPHTFILKSGVTYRKGLVDDQQVRRCIDGDCKRQPDIHAAGIYLYRLIYEAADICECGNAVEALISLASRQTQNGGIQVNIFTAGKPGLKPAPNSRSAAMRPLVQISPTSASECRKSSAAMWTCRIHFGQ